MTKRFAHIRTLAALRTSVLEYPNPQDAVHDAIVDALPPQYRNIYNWIISHGGENITSSFVVAGWRIAPNHASTLLKELWEYGLLERELKSDESGNRFEYKVAR